MIEVIYDKNQDKKVHQEDGQEKKEVSIGLKLPKNIRQIGTPGGNKRIYIEDYVVTYLNYIARPGSTSARGAILLGELKKSDVGDVIFISGAVDAQNLEFDMDESEFTKEAWSEIYEKVKEFFPDLSVVGWFLSRMGFSTAINEKIEKMHVENFPGNDKVLFITDSLECDDAFYMYEKGQLIKQKGYYIYYSKNEEMQNYIVTQKGGMSDEDSNEIKRKDDELLKNYRDKSKRVAGTKTDGVNLIYVASSFVVLAMLAMGITVISNYDKMRKMEVSLNRLELTAEQTTEDLADAMSDNIEVDVPALSTTQSVGVSNTEADNNPQEDYIESDTTNNSETASTEDTQSEFTEEPVISTEENLTSEEAVVEVANNEPTYYTIKQGDSLGTIALLYYGDVQFVTDIAQANNMSVDDKIYENQRIILPDIQ